MLEVGDGVVGSVDRAADPPRDRAAHPRDAEGVEHRGDARAGEVGGPPADLHLDDAAAGAAHAATPARRRAEATVRRASTSGSPAATPAATSCSRSATLAARSRARQA